jgi:hypothetical protein
LEDQRCLLQPARLGENGGDLQPGLGLREPALPGADRQLYIENLGNGRLLVAGSTRLDDLREYGLRFDAEGIDTVGGLIFNRLGALPKPGTVVLVGHIIHSDIRDTIEQIDSTGFAEVVDLSMSMPGITLKSSARIGINATGKGDMKKAVKLLRNIAREKDLLLIEPIETEEL